MTKFLTYTVLDYWKENDMGEFKPATTTGRTQSATPNIAATPQSGAAPSPVEPKSLLAANRCAFTSWTPSSLTGAAFRTWHGKIGYPAWLHAVKARFAATVIRLRARGDARTTEDDLGHTELAFLLGDEQHDQLVNSYLIYRELRQTTPESETLDVFSFFLVSGIPPRDKVVAENLLGRNLHKRGEHRLRTFLEE